MSTPWAVGILVQFGTKEEFRYSLCGVKARSRGRYLIRHLGGARRTFCFSFSERQTNPQAIRQAFTQSPLQVMDFSTTQAGPTEKENRIQPK